MNEEYETREFWELKPRSNARMIKDWSSMEGTIAFGKPVKGITEVRYEKPADKMLTGIPVIIKNNKIVAVRVPIEN